MAREPVAYRDNLEDILTFFQGKRMLNLTEVSTYLGKDRRWCRDHLNIDPKLGVSAPTLARKLSEGT